MACEQGANRVARLAGRVSAGVSALASKRGFYTGLALGGLGLVGAGLVAMARRRTAPPLVDANRVPKLGQRSKVRPLERVPASERCARCRATRESKPGAWYALGGRNYCPDCAPGAANRAGVDLVAPATQADPPVPARSRQQDEEKTLPIRRRVKTRLAPSRVGLYGGQGADGQPIVYAVENGYVALRPDGTDTGLAITPALVEQDGQPATDTNRWQVTHIASGMAIPYAGPYERREEAHLLAQILAQLDWTDSEVLTSPETVRRVGATINAYNQALGRSGSQWPTTVNKKPPAAEPLTGQLINDGYSGVARVLEDNGTSLFVVNSLGERYEVNRARVGPPTEGDFEGVRVARAFDPAQKRGASCARCGQAGGRDGGRWYRMNWQDFCSDCAVVYAAEEAYALEDEIGAELERL